MPKLRAYFLNKDCDEEGIWSILYGADDEGAVELDRYPEPDEARTEVEYLNLHLEELRQNIDDARAKRGAWDPSHPLIQRGL